MFRFLHSSRNFLNRARNGNVNCGQVLRLSSLVSLRTNLSASLNNCKLSPHLEHTSTLHLSLPSLSRPTPTRSFAEVSRRDAIAKARRVVGDFAAKHNVKLEEFALWTQLRREEFFDQYDAPKEVWKHLSRLEPTFTSKICVHALVSVICDRFLIISNLVA